MNKINEIYNKNHTSWNGDPPSLKNIKQMMREYAEWYAKKTLIEADDLFDWDHDLLQWTSDYKPSDIELPKHD